MFAKYMDQIGSAKKHNFKGQLQLSQPVATVTVIKLKHKEKTNTRFYKKKGFKRKPLLWSQHSHTEFTWAKYGKLGPNLEDGTLPFKEDGSTIYVQHNGHSILNKHRVPFNFCMKGLVYPYNPVTNYVSNLFIKFRRCFKCGKVHLTARSAPCPK